MERRRFLLATSASLTAGTAGCSQLTGGESGDGENATPTYTTVSGPAQFTAVEIGLPDDATVEEEFSVTVSARNIGGEAGEFEDTLEVASDASDFSQEFESDDVEPGDPVEVEVDGLSFATAGEYELELDDAAVSTTVAVGPQEATVGESLPIAEDIRATVTDVSLQSSVFYRTSRSVGFGGRVDELDAFAAPSDAVLALVSVEVTNTGTETIDSSSYALGIRDGEWYGSGDGVPGDIVGPSGQRFRDGQVPKLEPSETKAGYYLAKVPRETATGTLQVVYQADGSGTTPERAWNAPPTGGDERSFPTFDVSVDAPSTTELGRDYDLTVSVTNDGDGSGVFRGVVQWNSDGEWAQLQTATSAADLDVDRSTGGVIEREVDAGESAEVTLTSFTAFVRQYSYRLDTAGSEWEIQFEPASLTYGDRLKSGNDANIVVEDVRTADQLTVYDDWSNENETREPDDGEQYVAIQVRFTQRGDGSATTPSSGDFQVRADGSPVSDGVYVDGEIQDDWYSSPDGEIDEQAEVAGWLVKTMPDDYGASELSVRYENSYGFGSSVTTEATWQHE